MQFLVLLVALDPKFIHIFPEDIQSFLDGVGYPVSLSHKNSEITSTPLPRFWSSRQRNTNPFLFGGGGLLGYIQDME